MKLSAQERHKGKKNKMEKKRIILASGFPETERTASADRNRPGDHREPRGGEDHIG